MACLGVGAFFCAARMPDCAFARDSGRKRKREARRVFACYANTFHDHYADREGKRPLGLERGERGRPRFVECVEGPNAAADAIASSSTMMVMGNEWQQGWEACFENVLADGSAVLEGTDWDIRFQHAKVTTEEVLAHEGRCEARGRKVLWVVDVCGTLRACRHTRTAYLDVPDEKSGRCQALVRAFRRGMAEREGMVVLLDVKASAESGDDQLLHGKDVKERSRYDSLVVLGRETRGSRGVTVRFPDHDYDLARQALKVVGLGDADYRRNAMNGELFADLWEQCYVVRTRDCQLQLRRSAPGWGFSDEQEASAEQVVSTTRRGEPGVTVIHACAGSGKTRLCQEIRKRLAETQPHPLSMWYMTYNVENQNDFARKIDPERAEQGLRFVEGEDPKDAKVRRYAMKQDLDIKSETGLGFSLACALGEQAVFDHSWWSDDDNKAAIINILKRHGEPKPGDWHFRNGERFGSYLRGDDVGGSSDPVMRQIDAHCGRSGAPNRPHSWFLRHFANEVTRGGAGYCLPLPWKSQGVAPALWVVDEAQDLSMHTVTLLKNYARWFSHVVLVGDKHQCINTFKGAMPRGHAVVPSSRPWTMLGGPTTVHPECALSRSFRFGDDIASFVQWMMDPEGEGSCPIRGSWTAGDDDDEKDAVVFCHDVGDALQGVQYTEGGAECAILAHKNETLLSTAEALFFNRGVPCDLSRCRAKLLSTHKRLVKKKERDHNPKLEEWLQDAGTNGPSASCSLCTIHKSKGLEWANVVLDEECFPDDEKEMWYVAATRAKRRLWLTKAAVKILCADGCE